MSRHFDELCVPNLILNCKLAPIATASFFVIAIADLFNRLLHFVRNDKKDIVESGKQLLKKRDIGRPTSLYI
ncbi:hypothetical protein ACFO4P_09880 [Epilithonimonas pallida]|uniref:Uncharacterized protein n=1 Tax=Epilithonimonas pallida TaxID=373671 RepID=A0ABY1R2Z0_9FLAO|nr:hypothetical protein SAMN05421679_104256 [Epilithonimonas pallida]